MLVDEVEDVDEVQASPIRTTPSPKFVQVNPAPNFSVEQVNSFPMESATMIAMTKPH